MGKIALIILADGFEEIEAVSVIDILRRAQINVIVCGLTSLSLTGSRNIKIQAERILDEFKDNFDALILPGGSKGAENLKKSVRVAELIKKLNLEKKLIAAICATPAVVLSPLGILDGKTATCFPGMESEFSKKIIFSQNRVVVDGNIITSRGPGTAIEFGLKIAEKLVGTDKAKELKNQLVA
jgi:4-methyl-5(b-hydroxyethyl)-thiazole monophosphate biosynthesis